MNLRDSLTRIILRQKPNGNRFGPITRLYIFYMSVIGLCGFAFSQIISGGEILPLEIGYAFLVAAIVLFVLMFSTYSMIGVMHGRLGFKTSTRTAVFIAIATGTLSFLGGLSLNSINSEAVSIFYIVFIATVVAILQYGGVWIQGTNFADWADRFIGNAATYEDSNS